MLPRSHLTCLSPTVVFLQHIFGLLKSHEDQDLQTQDLYRVPQCLNYVALSRWSTDTHTSVTCVGLSPSLELSAGPSALLRHSRWALSIAALLPHRARVHPWQHSVTRLSHGVLGPARPQPQLSPSPASGTTLGVRLEPCTGCTAGLSLNLF